MLRRAPEGSGGFEERAKLDHHVGFTNPLAVLVAVDHLVDNVNSSTVAGFTAIPFT